MISVSSITNLSNFNLILIALSLNCMLSIPASTSATGSATLRYVPPITCEEMRW
ncbi:hypothetical protein K469DRAFT_717451 [Zopfia rhizophila CBS 207.26]|uniref:Uncharacterized protein n=1 Tax=Zopfia rhizophila CBS 207.26 TaxID=1314779 RepID=A0A6A6DI54_9PEZI|nr:hypothetical protein K469DRAFT_717451 [Zopfia rhizophila CBS 207.26]